MAADFAAACHAGLSRRCLRQMPMPPPSVESLFLADFFAHCLMPLHFCHAVMLLFLLLRFADRRFRCAAMPLILFRRVAAFSLPIFEAISPVRIYYFSCLRFDAAFCREYAFRHAIYRLPFSAAACFCRRHAAATLPISPAPRFRCR